MRRGLIVAVLLALGTTACSSAGDDAAPPPAHPDVSAVTTAPDSSSEVTTNEAASPSSSQPMGDEPSGTTTTTVAVPPSTLAGPRTTAAATEEDPVPVGEVVELTGLWDLSVTDVDFDAADMITEFAEINPGPEEGERYVLITVEGVFLGERVAEPAFEWAVSDGEAEYLPSVPGCGVVPDSIYDVTEVVPGQTFKANICVPVEEASISKGLTLFLQPLGDEARYFELG